MRPMLPSISNLLDVKLISPQEDDLQASQHTDPSTPEKFDVKESDSKPGFTSQDQQCSNPPIVGIPSVRPTIQPNEDDISDRIPGQSSHISEVDQTQPEGSATPPPLGAKLKPAKSKTAITLPSLDIGTCITAREDLDVLCRSGCLRGKIEIAYRLWDLALAMDGIRSQSLHFDPELQSKSSLELAKTLTADPEPQPELEAEVEAEPRFKPEFKPGSKCNA